MRRAARCSALATVTALYAVTACGGGPSVPAVAPSRLPATLPYLLMTSPSSGYATWPSGDQWVLLATRDGWRTITNATPAAVPTGGGLLVAAASGRIALAVGPYNRLTVSPVLSRALTSAIWQPAELPDAVVDNRNAVALRADRVTAVTSAAGGTVVIADVAGWTTLVTGRQLAGDRLALQTVTWADARVGWVTGQGPAGSQVAFQTVDAGEHWSALPVTGVGTTVALAPCGAGQRWLLPVIGDGDIRIWRTEDQGRSWASGAVLPLAAGTPAWGCAGAAVWMSAPAKGTEHLLASADEGRRWGDQGTTPAGLESLSLAGDGMGYAISHAGATDTLWAVTGDGATFTARAMPDWVASIGAGRGSTS